ncbi:hypothetical protein DPMN_121672 [Dreissena polymorpha]|uniref:Uncharacterized protein n=1 Tax=Dreissena polymorpha TaxID=45954 RepID=A0A9D4GQH8_DREPO|nr:hypothetical protein DPMN_121672 [Dreissena polymorpha]
MSSHPTSSHTNRNTSSIVGFSVKILYAITSRLGPECKSYRRDRQNNAEGGGVFLLVSNKYASDEPAGVNPPDDCEVVWCKIKVKGALDWLGGDFNLADIDWENECQKPQASNMKQCQQLLDIAKTLSLSRLLINP